ncbi:alkaline phosphatase family protein [Nonomuraea sp. NPDC050691]|uniref:alkaline phosphatase family protein n=1 Tax=Nonomuraea sp. NPDC050691 TaxID=3155661 RepID=UPI0033E0752E
MRDKVLVVGMDGLRFDRLVAIRPPVLSALMSTGAYGTSTLPYGEPEAPRTESPGQIVPEAPAGSPSPASAASVSGDSGFGDPRIGPVAPAMKDARATEGACATEDESVRVIRARTDSGPGWASIATGVWPDKHGVVDNGFAAPQFTKYPDFLTRAQEARPDLVTSAFFSWAALAEHGAFGPSIGTRFVLDGYALTWSVADRQVADAARDHLAGTGPDLSFVYLGDTDEVAHALGPLCPEYTDALLLQDAYLGGLLDVIRAAVVRARALDGPRHHRPRSCGRGRSWRRVGRGADGVRDRRAAGGGPRRRTPPGSPAGGRGPHGTRPARRRRGPGLGPGRSAAGVLKPHP